MQSLKWRNLCSQLSVSPPGFTEASPQQRLGLLSGRRQVYYWSMWWSDLSEFTRVEPDEEYWHGSSSLPWLGPLIAAILLEWMNCVVLNRGVFRFLVPLQLRLRSISSGWMFVLQLLFFRWVIHCLNFEHDDLSKSCLFETDLPVSAGFKSHRTSVLQVFAPSLIHLYWCLNDGWIQLYFSCFAVISSCSDWSQIRGQTVSVALWFYLVHYHNTD